MVKFHLVILDEINLAMDYGFINVNEVVELIKNKPQNLELVLTGRCVPREVIEVAELVT